MKLLLDIQPDKLTTVMDFLKNISDVSVEKITQVDADLLKEIKEIKQAFNHAKLIELGSLKGKPVKDLLNGL